MSSFLQTELQSAGNLFYKKQIISQQLCYHLLISTKQGHQYKIWETKCVITGSPLWPDEGMQLTTFKYPEKRNKYLVISKLTNMPYLHW